MASPKFRRHLETHINPHLTAPILGSEEHYVNIPPPIAAKGESCRKRPTNSKSMSISFKDEEDWCLGYAERWSITGAHKTFIKEKQSMRSLRFLEISINLPITKEIWSFFSLSPSRFFSANIGRESKDQTFNVGNQRVVSIEYKDRTIDQSCKGIDRRLGGIDLIERLVGPLVQEDVLVETNASFYHYLEKFLKIDPRVSKGISGPFIKDLNELIEDEAADPTFAPIEKSKGKRVAMSPPTTRGRLARDLLSQKKRQERNPSPLEDEPAHIPLAKRKSPYPLGDQLEKDPAPRKSRKKFAPSVEEELTEDRPA
ncbi:hypothetical protein AMTR_s00013p00260780 [Amborella trichopoda]|uniref:Uncharacterized protein n=1 Tax=Amborella trichopoda TaxID=13333 RepID=W1PJC7_AMBTC|nr:hypothetical protein AMTR_s00013p00260780 [Amborella trichopoda]